VRRELNRYTLAGYLAEVVPVVPYMMQQLGWLPIAWVQGRRGLRVWVYDPELPPVATLDATDEWDVIGDAGLTQHDPVQQVQLAYRTRGPEDQEALRTSQRSLYTELADPRGVVEQLSTVLCDDSASAELAAALRQRALHRRHRVLKGTLPRVWLARIEAGDTVDVYAPAWGVVGRGMVVEIADAGEARIEVEALVWRDPEQPFTAEADPFPEPVPTLPTYPVLHALWTVYSRILGLPAGTQSGGTWTAIADRAGGSTWIGPTYEFAYSDDLTPTSGTVSVGTGYAPGAAQEVATMTLSTTLNAWFFQVAGTPAYWDSRGGMVAVLHPMDIARANGDSLLRLLVGGNGTGGAATDLVDVDVLTGNAARIRIKPSSGSAIADVTPSAWSIPSVIAGTGNKASWVFVQLRWYYSAWQAIIIYDLGAGAGPVVAVDESWTATTVDSMVITRAICNRSTFGAYAFQSVAAYAFDAVPDADWDQLRRAMLYDVGVTSPESYP